MRKLLQKCTYCKTLHGGPYKLPKMPQLPVERVTRAKPFEFSGLDYFGPLWIKVGSEKVKVWVCLFTCLVTRAVYLDVAMDLSAASFLNCLRRFISRRSKPAQLISDNAPHFKLANSTVNMMWGSKVLLDDSVFNYCSSEGIEWHFIPEYAPWQGGVYESMVKITKTCLKKAIGRKLLDVDQFLTFLAEAEGISNSRPLTFVSEEIHSSQVLRPADFLVPGGMLGVPQMDDDPDDPEYLPKMDSKQKLVRYYTSSQRLLDKCWQFFYEEYLQSLRERGSDTHPQPRVATQSTPKEGPTP